MPSKLVGEMCEQSGLRSGDLNPLQRSARSELTGWVVTGSSMIGSAVGIASEGMRNEHRFSTSWKSPTACCINGVLYGHLQLSLRREHDSRHANIHDWIGQVELL